MQNKPFIFGGAAQNAIFAQGIVDELGLDNFGVFFTEHGILMGRIYNFKPDRNYPEVVTIEGYYTVDLELNQILAVKKYDLSTDAWLIPPPD
ncbi:MAG: hypothetical protein AMDU3_IPLC00004G0006 [Thermoplasmatales archaeon I-plasma]|nr:MAG: hypothetical protein AMDU3_IPLC00004G0006 [Thermoplasmatales archaeon I-plasma]